MNSINKSFALAVLLGAASQGCAVASKNTEPTGPVECNEVGCAYVNSVDKVDASLLLDLCAKNSSAIYKCLWKGDSTHSCLNDTVSTLKCNDTLLSTELNAKNYQGYQGLCAETANIKCFTANPDKGI